MNTFADSCARAVRRSTTGIYRADGDPTAADEQGPARVSPRRGLDEPLEAAMGVILPERAVRFDRAPRLRDRTGVGHRPAEPLKSGSRIEAEPDVEPEFKELPMMLHVVATADPSDHEMFGKLDGFGGQMLTLTERVEVPWVTVTVYAPTAGGVQVIVANPLSPSELPHGAPWPMTVPLTDKVTGLSRSAPLVVIDTWQGTEGVPHPTPKESMVAWADGAISDDRASAGMQSSPAAATRDKLIMAGSYAKCQHFR